MSNHNNDIDGVKKVKNIAAVVYLLVLTFLVGGSYIDQHRAEGQGATQAAESAQK